MAKGKEFKITLFDRSDRERTIITSGQDLSISSFDHALNGGLGQLTMDFGRLINNFGEGTEIDLGYRIEVRTYDREAPNGKMIYQGFINELNPSIRGQQHNVRAIALGHQTLFSKRLHVNGSSTSVNYTSRELAYIVRDIISKLNGRVTTTAGSVENTGTIISYIFRNNTVKEALDKIIDLAPDGFYWVTDANNLLTFAKANYGNPDHILVFGRHFNEIDIHKSYDNMYNSVYFVGGGSPNLFRRTQRSSAIQEWGQLDYRFSDERVTDTDTADKTASSFLDRSDHPNVNLTIKILDSNYPADSLTGYDIERFRPGQVVLLRGLGDDRTTLWDQSSWDVDFWDYNFLGALANPFIISSMTYEFDSITLRLGTFQNIFGRDFTSMQNRLGTVQYQNLPDTPTAV